MSLEEKIYQDYLQALKSKDKIKLTFLSFLRSELKNQAISLKKKALDDDEVLGGLKKQQKRLQDSKESIASSGRQDLIENLDKELNILQQYLPQPLSEQELTTIINEVIASTGAVSMKDMGKVMKEVISKVGVRADSRKVSALVKEKLSNG